MMSGNQYMARGLALTADLVAGDLDSADRALDEEDLRGLTISLSLVLLATLDHIAHEKELSLTTWIRDWAVQAELARVVGAPHPRGDGTRYSDYIDVSE